MKKKIVTIFTLICIMVAFTACGKAQKVAGVLLESETTVTEAQTTEAPTAASTEAPTTVAETTPAATEAPTAQQKVIHDVIVETVPVYQDVVSPYRDTKAVASVLATYNNPEYTDFYAVFNDEYEAVVLFIYGDSNAAYLKSLLYPQDSPQFKDAEEVMKATEESAKSNYIYLLDSNCYVDVWIVYSDTYSVNTNDLWANSWLGYSARDNEWVDLTK